MTTEAASFGPLWPVAALVCIYARDPIIMTVFSVFHEWKRTLPAAVFVLAFLITAILPPIGMAQEATPIADDQTTTATSPEQQASPPETVTSALNKMVIQADTPGILLTHNGSTEPLYVEPGTPVNFVVTGDLGFGPPPATLEIRNNSCLGTTFDNVYIYTPVFSPFATAYSFNTPGTYGVSFSFNQQGSNCLIVQVGASAPSLTANGSTADVAASITAPVQFSLSGNWPLNATGISYTISHVENESCTGTPGETVNYPTAPVSPILFERTFTMPGQYAAYGSWNGYNSDCIIINVTTPEVALTSAGSTDPLSLDVFEAATFDLASTWPAGAENISYSISNATCDGEVISTQTLIDVPASSTSFDLIFDTPGVYAVQGAWGAWSSDCIIVTVLQPIVSLTANDSVGPIEVVLSDDITFSLTSIWPAGAENVTYTVSSVNNDLCEGTLLQTVTLSDVPAGSIEFDLLWNTSGQFAVQGFWNGSSSNCIIVNVVEPIQPTTPTPEPTAASTITPTIVPTEIATTTPSPEASTPSPGAATPTEDPAVPTATADDSPTATVAVVSSLPETGNGSSASIITGSFAVIAVIMLAALGLVRKRG